jgi:hypothetical protein
MKKLFGLMSLIGFFVLVCAAGASDMEIVSFSQTVLQCVFGAGLMAGGVLGNKAVDRYQKRKKLNERFYRVQTICAYESNRAA